MFDRISDPLVVMELIVCKSIECAKALNASGFQMHSCKNHWHLVNDSRLLPLQDKII